MITQYVADATALYLGHASRGFNAIFATVAAAYRVDPIVINWTPSGSLQFFQAFGTPDDLDESSASKYPMVFLYGAGSQNTHESLGRQFAGPVRMTLTFWVTHKAAAFSKAAPVLERVCNAIEDTCNQLFTDGNWPQRYGATNSVCLPPACTRSRVEGEGEMWRQAVSFNMVFTLDTN
jgi:hypothetical protein